MDAETRENIENMARDRSRAGVLESEADFFTGAMTAYLVMNPESEEDGSWCPTEWVFTLMRGDSIIEGGEDE